MPDTRAITATLVVNFGQQAGARTDGLVAEIDNRPDGLNAGRTAFSPGDEVFILLYKTSNITLNAAISSAGILTRRADLSPVFIEKEQDLQFVDRIEQSLSYPIPVDVAGSGVWLGNDLGFVTQRTEIVLGIPQPVSEHWAGVYRHTHIAQADVYHLTNTLLPFEDYPIVCHFAGIAV